MTTTVGNQSEYLTALKALLELEYDALEAYDAAINCLENSSYQDQIKNFRNDHQCHITSLTSILTKHGQTPPTGPTLKSILTQGKVVIGNLINDDAILRAMASNEEDTNTAYGRLCQYANIPDDELDILEQAYNDEKLHKEWIAETLSDENDQLRHFG